MYLTLNLYQHKNKQKYIFAVLYDAGIVSGLASIAQAPWGGSTVLPSKNKSRQSDQTVFSAKLCSQVRLGKARLAAGFINVVVVQKMAALFSLSSLERLRGVAPLYVGPGS